MTELSKLTSAEIDTLQELRTRWCAAREAKNYHTADTLRTELAQWGVFGRDMDCWHPVFETPAHRLSRSQQ